nr:hypothetical protein [Tanacetum cinerariifolium]
MAAIAIIVSSDSSDESVGSPPSRVILFGDIPAIIPYISMVSAETNTTTPIISSAAHVAGTTLVTSPTGLCGLDPYMIVIDHWRSKVASYPSSSSEYPIAPIVALPRTRRPPVTLVRPREVVPFGRSYRTHHRSSSSSSSLDSSPVHSSGLDALDHRSSSSSSSLDSSPVHSSGLDALGQAYSGSSTRVVSPRLGYPPRCRSPADSVPSSTPVTLSLASTRVDLLPPRKRELAIVDGDDVKDQVEVDPRDDREEFEASSGDTIVLRIDPRSVLRVDEEIVEPVRGDSSSSSGTRDGTVRSIEDMSVDLDDAIRVKPT